MTLDECASARRAALVAEYAGRGLDIRLHDVNAAAGWEDGDYWIWGIHLVSNPYPAGPLSCYLVVFFPSGVKRPCEVFTLVP